jgi:hypothetical protein
MLKIVTNSHAVGLVLTFGQRPLYGIFVYVRSVTHVSLVKKSQRHRREFTSEYQISIRSHLPKLADIG